MKTQTYNARNLRFFILALAITLFLVGGLVILALGVAHTSIKDLKQFRILICVIVLGDLTFLVPSIANMVFSVIGRYVITFDDESLTIERKPFAMSRRKTFRWADIQQIGIYAQAPGSDMYEAIGIQTKRIYTFGNELPQSIKRALTDELSMTLKSTTTKQRR